MSGLDIAGLGERLPDAVLVRSMSGGTFQAVTLRLGILHALRENGVLVWNDARAIERCVDKSMTSFLLARAGIPTPPAWAIESHAAAQAIVRRESAQGPLVLKPLFGSQGRGLKLLYSVAWPGQGIYTKEPLKSVADLKGTKFRTYSPLTARLAELLGANPTVVQVPDVPQMFATGGIQAMITSSATGTATKAWG